MSKNEEIEYKKIPKLKYWLKEQGITMDDLAARTRLSIRTVHKLANTGIVNKSVILLVSYELGMKEEELIKMLITQENKDYFKKEELK